ncbi:MAG: putative Fe-S cluster assembly protein SufT [Candidatus Omnitrophica bacterium]|nr:putative Fe-S cluster assembly protein SufT [Candidatus Omnitrophota bacterium]
MSSQEVVTLKRECVATEIPSGKQIILYPGTDLRLTQALGGTFTVTTMMGQMASILGKDADAIGKEIPEEVKKTEEAIKEDKPVEDLIWTQLRTCYDPEIPHNIVDLGLIYECKISDFPLSSEPGDTQVNIRMTLTAPGCGMGEWLKQDIRNKLMVVPKVKEVSVELVFDPPWNPSKMHPALRRSLNM